ncbi:substrate carrier family protein ucpB [Thecamonas trahens ATCC 50062]|uniref:Substrate carrier family protein ucpB n=1 Tax=Thecamonas trahens ATCC 50062 TaxID=461836 RepID=A0A0L0DP82_THETB|nr:substrate carrier family protein ucpB [Thecamonas trahens ATCC 50062]KNC54104.1 substrate carrier family protein ucpB [Thecamonas trahens ATCC 50062]|eukprot:XP_013753927.1 substrate carrier family protein ucpB [Thecamonas trahens ATCC 50062]
MATSPNTPVPQVAIAPEAVVEPRKFELLRSLASGGIANTISSIVLNFSDVAKVRSQCQKQAMASNPNLKPIYNTFTGTMRVIVKEEGIGGLLLPGMGASILRELSYSSIRLGLYPIVKRAIGTDDEHGDVGLAPKIAASLMTGALGSAIANPTDRIKIMIQQEAGLVDPKTGRYITGLAKGSKPSFNGTFAAFVKIYRTEGFLNGLYRGVGPTVVRAALLTCGQMASYDHAKHLFKRHGILNEGFSLHFSCAIIAAVVANTMCAPADLVKSRYMADRAGASPVYKSAIDCLIKTVRAEGIRGLYIGYTASLYRLGPHFVATLPALEWIRKNIFGLDYV